VQRTAEPNSHIAIANFFIKSVKICVNLLAL